MPKPWTFLTNHALVLLAVADHPDATLREIAEQVGVTERSTFSIVHDLVEAGYVVQTKEKGRNHYEVRGELPLRHPLSQQASLKSLLAALRREEPADQPPAARTIPRR